ncbi:glutamyl-tRNA reductase [Leucobacter aridicollis]|nr:glutamyl-tRNA reductase [Leucobacter aridicollis]
MLFVSQITLTITETRMLLSLSFSLERAPFELLEALSKRSEDIAAGLDDPTLTVGSVVLATCNRFEIYAETGQGRPEPVLARVAASTGIDVAELAAASSSATDHDTAAHLFAVAAGLQSAVVGESEIAGQVRRAHDDARARGTLTHDLEHLFRTATRTSREVGHRTDIRSAGRSLVRLALRMAEARVADWGSAHVLLIGTGAYAGATVAALRARGAGAIRVYSPSGRAETYAAEHDLIVVPQGELAEALSAADVVVACTRAEEPVLTAELLRPGAAETNERLLIDLGMPRNIEHAVAELPGIELLDLETVSKHAPVEELSTAAEAHEIVRQAADEFSASRAERDALPALLALRTHVMGILEDELCRARAASQSAASAGAGAGLESPTGAGADTGSGTGTGAGTGVASDRTGVASDRTGADATFVTADYEAALRRFTGKLLHTPMTRIRTLGREGRVPAAAEALETLFGIETQSGGPTHAD